MNLKPYKIVVFDLDETLGYFKQIGVFWNILQKYYKKNFTQDFFTKFLDLYPEILRPNIVPILHYLKLKKREKRCYRVMIYTNNQAPKQWCEMIKTYFDSKVKYKLFDKIIRAFKINGKVIEVNRTTTQKTVDDFFKCTKLPKSTEICFIDDNYFDKMNNDNVYYVHLKSYVYTIPNKEVIERFFSSNIGKSLEKKVNNDPNNILRLLNRNFDSKNHDEIEYELHRIISKKIMYHLQIFFKNSLNNNNTRKTKNKKNYKNKTIKFYQ